MGYSSAQSTSNRAKDNVGLSNEFSGFRDAGLKLEV